MKIGIDARLWNETGVGRYIRNLVTQLALLDAQNTYVLFVRQEDSECIRKSIPTTWKLVTVSITWHSLQEQFTFLPILYKENLDLMHFPYFSLPILYRRPFVVTIHDLIIHSFATGKASTLPLPVYLLKRLAYKTVIQQATKKARKVIVPLKAVKKEVEKTLYLPGEKVIVTYEGFDSQIAHNKLHLKPKELEIGTVDLETTSYFLYVGNTYPHKNVDTLIKAFLSFSSLPENGQYVLVIVGKEDYFSGKIKSKFKQHKNIIFLHNVSDSTLGYLYNHAVALMSASFMEGFGLPCLEAAESECVVAVSDIAAFREVCQENALYFNPEKEESVREAFFRVIHLSPEEKKTLIVGGRRNAERFSWEKMAQETIKIYESSLSI